MIAARRSVLALWTLASTASAAPAADAPGSVVPARAYDIEALHLDLHVDPTTRTVRGTARYSARPLHDAPLVLQHVDVHITAVRGIDTAAPPHRVHPDRLVLDTTAEHIGEDGTLDIEVDFEARPWTGVHFRSPPHDPIDEVWTQGQRQDHRHWFPSWDHPNDRFAYTGTITAPDGWKAVTNSGHDLPTYLIMFAAGPYEEVVHATDPTTRVWVPPGTPPSAIASVLDPVPAMKAHFQARTGAAYPWGDYLQVFVQRFLYFGMENTGATINSARALVDDRVAATRPRVENLIAHELAHQWFGDLLTCRTWRDLWLNEGFATFMAGDYVVARHTHLAERDAVYAEQVLRWYARSLAQPQPMARRWHHPTGPDAFNVYNRGAATLVMLRAHVGEDAFWTGVQTYVARHAHGPVETVDLRRAFEDTTGHDLTGFFQQWTERTGSPTLTVTERRKGDELVITVKQRTSTDTPLFHVPVELQIQTAKGPTTVSDLMTEDSLQFRVPVDGEVRWVAADPRGAVLAKWEHDQSALRLEAMAIEGPPVARIRAIKALGKTDQATVLASIVANSREPEPYRTAAAEALGKQRAHTALIAALDTPSQPVREAIAKALGDCFGADTSAALDRIIRTDPNPDIRAVALDALSKADPGRALKHARGLTRLSDREETRLAHTAYATLGAHGTARDLKLLTDPRLPFRNRNRALSAAAAWVQDQPDPTTRERYAPMVARATEPLLLDTDLRTRQSAIDTLGKVGDERSIAPLEAHARATHVEHEASAARRAILAIRSRDRPDYIDPAAKKAAELKALEDRLDAIEKRLESREHHH